MKLKHEHSSRQGLTLIELIVVLVVLIALAGILIPMLPSMLGRAHTASGATTVGEINKFVQIYEQLYQEYPRDLDNLSDPAAATTVDYVPGSAVPTVFNASSVLTAAEVNALTNAGITRVASLHPTKAALDTAGGTPTFNPYNGAPVPVAAGTFVARLNEAIVESTIVRDEPANTGDVYVVFGLGKASTMTGKVVADAPVHFGENNATNAANKYTRYGLVFRLARGNGTATPTPLERAIFVGAVAFHDDSITGVDGHLEEYYNITKAQ